MPGQGFADGRHEPDPNGEAYTGGGAGNGNGGGGNGNGNGGGGNGGGGNGNGNGNGNGGGGGDTGGDTGGADLTAYDTWDDYWPNTLPASGFNPIIPDLFGKVDNGLPQCSAVNPTANADRRVVVVAGIDCPPGVLKGDADDVPVVQYYRTFLLEPARNTPGGGPDGTPFEILVEIIEPIGGEGGGSTAQDTAFREVIQLYR